MEELEFSKELVMLLDKNILQKTLKGAVLRGFTVHGFNKDVWKAPAVIVNAALGKRKRGGQYQCRIFLECLAELEEDNEEVELAKKWLRNGEKRVEAIEKLEEIMSCKRNEQNVDAGDLSEVISNDVIEKDEKKEQNADMVLQQERIRKLQKDIQQFRISIDNCKKEIEHLRKEKSKLEKEYEKEWIKNNKLDENNKELEKQISKYQQQLIQKDEEIDYYKGILDKAPKILCFSKKKINTEIFPLRKIEQMGEWRNELVDEIEWKEYQEVWIVESDFSYPEVMNICNTIKEKKEKMKIIRVPNLKSLIMKVGGIK